MIIEYAKYPLWTLWRFLVDFRLAVRNTGIMLAAFARTVALGRRAIAVLESKHATWSERTRGRYIWRVASRFWAQWIVERAGLRVARLGFDRVDWSRPHIVVANHQSTLDILLIVALLPAGRFVAKKEILAYPVIGAAARHGGQILIDRRDHEQSMSAIRDGVRRWPGSNLVFFAEGTRSRTGELRQFKKGAFAIARETGLPIVPVAISGTFDALPKGSLLRLRPNPRVRIEVGEAIPCQGSVADLAERTRDVIGRMIRRTAPATKPVPAGLPSLQPGA